MARCEKRKVVPQPPVPFEYVLTLSADEAYTLASLVFDSIKFDGKTKAHDVLEDIYRSLYDAGAEGCELGEFCSKPESLEIRDDFDPSGWHKNESV